MPFVFSRKLIAPCLVGVKLPGELRVKGLVARPVAAQCIIGFKMESTAKSGVNTGFWQILLTKVTCQNKLSAFFIRLNPSPIKLISFSGLQAQSLTFHNTIFQEP